MSIVFKSNLNEKLEGLTNKVNMPTNNDTSYKHLVKADALRIQNHFWDSIEEYLAALEIDGNNIEAFKGLGLSYKQVGFIKSAVNAFNSAKKLNPFDKYLYFEAGCCYCMEEKFPQAITEFKKAIKIAPDYLDARHKLAMVYELSQKYDLAIKEYNKLIEMNPENIQAYNNLGSLYMKLDKYQESIKTFKDLLKFNSEYTRAYLGIAISCDKTGDKTNAMRYYKKYLKQMPNSENVPYIIDRIYEIKKLNSCSSRRAHLMLVS